MQRCGKISSKEVKRNGREIMEVWGRNEQGDGAGKGEKCNKSGRACKMRGWAWENRI